MKKFLLLCSIGLMSFGGFSQCVASFSDSVTSWTSNPNDIFFTNTSTGYTGGGWTTFYWTFQGGTPSYSFSPDTVNVVFNGSGPFVVCLNLADSFNNCVVTYCDTISFTTTSNPSASATSTSTTCGSCNGSATASVSGGTAPYTYLWSNGGTTSTISSLCAGNYTVTVTDNNSSTSTASVNVVGSGSFTTTISASSTMPCANDSIVTLTANTNTFQQYQYLWSNGATTQTTGVNASGLYAVTVTDSNGCQATDSILITWGAALNTGASSTNETCTSCCDGTASVSPSGGSGGYSYAWSNSSTGSSISSLCPGNYTVTITDTASNCTTVESFVIAAYSCGSIAGNIQQGHNARVYLIEFSGTNNSLSALDSVLTDSTGNYLFSNVCAGTYHVKAALLPAHTSYFAFVPTYYDSASLWSASTAVTISTSVTGIDIDMIPGINPGGPGFVGGLITQGANKGPGDPIENVTVILTDLNDIPLDFTKSDANGAYSFDLPYGEYRIYVDKLNRTSYPHQLTIDEEASSVTSADFLVNSQSVNPIPPLTTTGVELGEASIFPNPTNNIATIRSTQLVHDWKVFNLLGEVVLSNTVGTEQFDLNLSELSPSTYILELNGEFRNEYHRITKQ